MILHSKWRLELTKAIHSLKNRYRIANASQGNGTFDPTLGQIHDVNGLPQWELVAEYQEVNQASWKSSKMKIVSRTQNGAELSYVIGAEDPLPTEDFEDLQWEARFEGRMFDIPYRPYAVRASDLFQMPDGIFDTLLGSYYMGVRVQNVYAEEFGPTHTLDITNACRAVLATKGVFIGDAWSQQELAQFGQQQVGRGISVNGLKPGDSRTIFFKINVSTAAPRKYEMQFIHVDVAGTPDPHNPKRLLSKHIFVSSSHADSATGELVCTVKEGTIRLKLLEVAYDVKGARRARKKCKPCTTKSDLQGLRSYLEHALKEGDLDICDLKKIVERLTQGVGCCDPSIIRTGKYCIGSFFVFPTKYKFIVEPSSEYEGQFGPIPFDDPWWKVALLILAVLLLIAGVLSEAADIAFHDEDLVIGTLDRFQANDVDAALCRLDGRRTETLREIIDARADEPNTTSVTALGGLISLNTPVITRAEIDAFLTASPPDPNNLRVFKSGGRTGLTFGIISSTTSDGHGLATWGIGQLLITIDTDPAFGNGMGVSDSGDSGSVWVHHATRRPVGLNHSGDSNGTTFAVASFLEDVQTAMNVTF